MADRTRLPNVPASQLDVFEMQHAITERLDALEAKITPPSGTPILYNITMTSANTEYVQALPDGTKKFSIKCRDGTAFRMAYETGKVASPTEPYITIPANTTKWEDYLYCQGVRIYVGCASAAKVACIEAWR